MKKTNPYKVPKNYFDQVEGDIQARIAKKQSGFVLVFPSWARVALPTVIGIVGVWFFLFQNTPQPCETLACIDDEELYAEVMDYDAMLWEEVATPQESEVDVYLLDYDLDDIVEP